MKMNKRLLRLFGGCALGAAILINAFSVEASDMVVTTAVDLSDSCWNGFGGSGSFVQSDGTKIEVTKKDEVSIEIKDNASDFITDTSGAEKYLMYSAETGKGANSLKITPRAALAEDFSFEFKAAGKKPNAQSRYLSVVMLPKDAADVSGTTVMGWSGSGYLYDIGSSGQSTRYPSEGDPLRVNIPNWGGRYAISFSTEKLESYRIDVHFNADDVPTFDLWGYYVGENTGLDVDGEGRQLLLENVKFADGADYSKGFGSIKIELGSERGGEGIGIADMKILERGKIILSDIYSDNMILPKNKPFAVRGYGLSGGAEITAQILDDADHVVAETSDVTNETGSFACSFSSLSGLDSAESYKMLLKSGTLEKTINNIAVGDIWVFGGSEKISAVSGSGNGNRLFLTDETGKGQWKYAEDCAELGAQAEILGRLKERNGNNAGGIVGLKNAEAFLPEGVIYLASVNDLKNGIGQLGEYVETARENNIRIIYTVPCGGEGLSAEELFSLRCEAAALEKANYGVVKSVPTVRADSASDIIERIVNGIYDEYVSLTDYELSVLGNKAYLFLSDNIEEAYGDDFLAETTSGRVCGAEKAEKSGSVIELTFNTDEDIIKLYYGKNGITLPIYSDDRRTVLMPFVCDYDGKEEFDFAKEYDRARFEKLYCAASGMFSGSGLTVSEGDMLVRDKLGYPIDDVKISMSLAGSGRIQLFINEEKLFEGELLNDNTISIQKNDAGLKINGRTVESSIERIDKLTVKFTDVSDLLLTGFKIDMPQYSDVLAVVIGLNGLPDSDTAAYDDVEDIAELCDKYDELGGETNSFFSSEVHEKVERLKSFCKKIDAEKKSIREKVEAAFSVTEENHRVTIGLSNSSSLVPFDVECLAVVYDSEGMLVSISSERKTVAPNGTERVELSPSLTGAENGYINYYVINDAASGYIIGADVKNEL